MEAAKAATAKLEAEATERHHRSESELARLRGHLEDFQTKLSTEQAAVAEWKQRNAELESSLLKTSSELGNLQTEARKQGEERGRLEFELRAQLDAAREKTGYAEAALKEETLRKEKLEERLQSLSNSLKLEQAQRSKRFEEELVGLRKERDELNGKLAAEKQAASGSAQRAQELESSLSRNASEFERAKAELDRQSAEREESESKWREQLDTAWVLKEKLEGAWAGAVERNKRFEEELAALRQERNELNGKLQAEKDAAEESRFRAREVENRLGRNATEFERAKSELEKQSAEWEAAESEWREQLQAAKTKKEKTERALAEATERSQRFEAELAALRREHDKLTAELETAQQAATAATRRAEDCQSRLTRNTDELARVRADLEKQDAEYQRSESRWREQLETAKAQKREVDASWESAVERTMRFEQELAGLRLERDELKGKLKTQQQETARLLRQTEDLESRLQRTTAEHDRVQAELERHNAERERSGSERSQQRETAKVLTRKLETARAGAVERNKRVEGELAEIRHERDELQDKLTAEHVVAAEFRKRAEELENRLAQHAGELQRVRMELEKQNTDRERLESEWRKRLQAPAPPKKSDGPSPGASGGSGGRRAEADLCQAPHISVERYNLKP